MICDGLWLEDGHFPNFLASIVDPPATLSRHFMTLFAGPLNLMSMEGSWPVLESTLPDSKPAADCQPAKALQHPFKP